VRRELKIAVILLILSYFSNSIRTYGYEISVFLLVLAYIVSFKPVFSMLCEALWGIPLNSSWKTGSWKLYRKIGKKYEVAALLKVENIQWSTEDYTPSKFASVIKAVMEKILKLNPVILIKKESELNYYIFIRRRGKKLIDLDRDIEASVRFLLNSAGRTGIDLEVCDPKEFFSLFNLTEKKIDRENLALIIVLDFFSILAAICTKGYLQVVGILLTILFTLSLFCFYRGKELNEKYYYADAVEVGEIADTDIQDFSELVSNIINTEENAKIVIEVEKASTRIEAELERKAAKKYFAATTFDWLGTLVSSFKILERARRRRERKEFVYLIRLYTTSERIKEALEGYGFSFIRLPLKAPVLKAFYG